ncbi:MAG: hypothetical protein L0H96_04105 [Humibacillus sp.]|nr:hypothetical protein [Humibacillus sp.]
MDTTPALKDAAHRAAGDGSRVLANVGGDAVPTLNLGSAHRILMEIEGSPLPPVRSAEAEVAKEASGAPRVRVRRSSEAWSPLDLEAWAPPGRGRGGPPSPGGTARAITTGEVLLELEQDSDDFVFVKKGSVVIIGRADDPDGGRDRSP